MTRGLFKDEADRASEGGGSLDSRGRWCDGTHRPHPCAVDKERVMDGEEGLDPMVFVSLFDQSHVGTEPPVHNSGLTMGTGSEHKRGVRVCMHGECVCVIE